MLIAESRVQRFLLCSADMADECKGYEVDEGSAFSESGSSDEAERTKLKSLTIGSAQGSGGSRRRKKARQSGAMQTRSSTGPASKSAMEEEVGDEVNRLSFLFQCSQLRVKRRQFRV